MLTLLLLLAALGAAAHVPTYGRCADNCCTLPRAHTVSQVLYLRGAGGLEVPLAQLRGADTIDFDVVFRDEVDQTTYDLFVGCGGCVGPIAAGPPLPAAGYAAAELEPFTQTAYRSAVPSARRTFRTSRLSNCTQSHFGIRLVDYGNRSRGEEAIVWGPVIGLSESFTPTELLSFPVYILRNHGSAWNELGFTYWVWLFVGAPLIVYAERGLIRRGQLFYVPHPFAGPVVTTRDVLYELATVGFAAAGLEELTHLTYAQQRVSAVGATFWIGFVAVILLPHLVGTVAVFVSWRGHQQPARYPLAASRAWGAIDVLLGVALLFVFGAGFYVGPAFLILAGLWNLGDAPERPRVGARAPSGVARVRGGVGNVRTFSNRI